MLRCGYRKVGARGVLSFGRDLFSFVRIERIIEPSTPLELKEGGRLGESVRQLADELPRIPDCEVIDACSLAVLVARCK